MNGKIAARAAVASAVLAGSIITGTVVASASPCLPGKEAGQSSCEASTVSAVTPSIGVDFRDTNGDRTSSGLSDRDEFEWLGGKKMGNGTDGILIEVRQITKGRGGWGPLYIGWIPVKYTQAPSIFK